MPRIYAFVNQKGGVGKTTTAINMGAFLAQQNQRVLLVDLDPQGNATSSLGVDKKTLTTGTYPLLLGEDLRLDAHTLHNTALQMSLVPAGPGLAAAEVELVPEPLREYRLRTVLLQAERYDYVLIDCPPSLGLLTLNGLVAADSVVIPVQCEFFALEGLGQLLETIYRVRRAFKTPLRIRGLLMTMYDGRAHLSQQVVDEVRKHFPGKVFRAVVPRNVRLAEAPSHGLPISAYDPNCSGARAYAAATEELLQGDLAGTPA